MDKVYAEFSKSAKKTNALRDCFEFLNMDFHQMLKNVPTRWLSLEKSGHPTTVSFQVKIHLNESRDMFERK